MSICLGYYNGNVEGHSLDNPTACGRASSVVFGISVDTPVLFTIQWKILYLYNF